MSCTVKYRFPIKLGKTEDVEKTGSKVRMADKLFIPFHKEYPMEKKHKKILSLDGGGIKGALTLGLLSKFEKLLKEKNGENYKLAEYFDLIGGTSTGAIIASGLATGMSVSEVKDKYIQLGKKVFAKKRPLFFLFGGGYFTSRTVKRELCKVFGNLTLSDKSIQTGLAIFAKRIDTQSLWIIYNNPKHQYWKYQKDYLLREAIRASTAAPTYFEAEKIDVKNDGSQIGDFVDGGLSVANNPSLNLFLLTTIPNYGYNWNKGKENLSIYSFGTGRSITANLPSGFIKSLGWAKKAPSVLMEDISEQNEIILQLFSHANHPRFFDKVLKKLEDIEYLTPEPLLNYYRYNVDFTPEYLNDKLGYKFCLNTIEKLKELDNPTFVETLYEIGEKASYQINETHLK